MDFALSEQQQLMRTEVRHLARQFAWSYWRELDRTSTYPHEFFNAFAAAGWLGTVISTAYGGIGLLGSACIVLGEIAASGAGTSGASPIHFSMFPPMPIIKYGSEEMKQRYLPKIASGEMKLAFSVTEPNVGSDTTHIYCFPTCDARRVVINSQGLSSNAQQADRVLILTHDPVAPSAKNPKAYHCFSHPWTAGRLPSNPSRRWPPRRSSMGCLSITCIVSFWICGPRKGGDFPILSKPEFERIGCGEAVVLAKPLWRRRYSTPKSRWFWASD
jgi:alkylation response protein AidB-like acyl-CoA dehydrogenase